VERQPKLYRGLRLVVSAAQTAALSAVFLSTFLVGVALGHGPVNWYIPGWNATYDGWSCHINRTYPSDPDQFKFCMGAYVNQNSSTNFVWERLRLDYGVEYTPPAFYGITTIYAQQTGAVIWQGYIGGECARVYGSYSQDFYMNSQARDGSWEQWSAQGDCHVGTIIKDFMGVLGLP